MQITISQKKVVAIQKYLLLLLLFHKYVFCVSRFHDYAVFVMTTVFL